MPRYQVCTFLRILNEMSLALSFWKLLIVFSISSISHGDMKMLPDTLLFKNFSKLFLMGLRSALPTGLEGWSLEFNFLATEEKSKLNL